MSLNLFPTDYSRKIKDDHPIDASPESKIKIPEQPANLPRHGKAVVENYYIGIHPNNFPYLEFTVLNKRFEGNGGEVFPTVELTKEFYNSMIDGVYLCKTIISLVDARLEKHSHITTETATIYRYVLIFEKMSIKTEATLIEKRENPNKVSDLERSLLTKQIEKAKSG